MSKRPILVGVECYVADSDLPRRSYRVVEPSVAKIRYARHFGVPRSVVNMHCYPLKVAKPGD